MKVVTWNCAMAFHKKSSLLFALGGDVMVVQECSKKSIDQIATIEGLTAAWFGKNPNKGMAVICNGPWHISDSKDFGLTWAAHIKITGPFNLDLYPVWACAGSSYDNRYIRQVHLLLDQLEKIGIGQRAALLGDFNSNVLWDKNYRGCGHSSAVKRLAALGLHSAYHRYHGEEQGKEARPTLAFRKDRTKAYHIDYIFLSQTLLSTMSDFSVGSFDDWIKHSDHVPLIVNLVA
jgi:exodeoxyribonuclease III